MFFAYIDPGLGSMVLQFLVAVVVGATLFFRRIIVSAVLWIKTKLFGK